MQLAPHATRRTPYGDSRLVQPNNVCLVSENPTYAVSASQRCEILIGHAWREYSSPPLPPFLRRGRWPLIHERVRHNTSCGFSSCIFRRHFTTPPPLPIAVDACMRRGRPSIRFAFSSPQLEGSRGCVGLASSIFDIFEPCFAQRRSLTG